MIQQEWIAQQIQTLVQFVARLFFGKDTIEYQIVDVENLTETDRLFNEINRLLDDNKIGEAENLLFENIDQSDHRYLLLAIAFYQRINRFSDEELEDADFSRDEVYSGLMDIVQEYGLPKII